MCWYQAALLFSKIPVFFCCSETVLHLNPGRSVCYELEVTVECSKTDAKIRAFFRPHQVQLKYVHVYTSSAFRKRFMAVVQDRSVDVIRNVEVQEVQDLSDGVRLSLSNGNSVECDFVIWATGVIPCTGVWKAGCEEVRVVL